MPLSGPLVLRRPIDLAPERLASTIGSWNGPALLEGGPGLGQAGRWSILAARPRRVLESADGTSFRWSGESPERETPGDAFQGLEAATRRYHLADPADLLGDDPSPFQGGLIGYLGYDLAPILERLPRRSGPDSPMPALRFGLYDTFVLVDHQRAAAELWAVDLQDEGRSRLEERIGRWQADLRTSEAPRPRTILGPARPDLSREQYLEAVGRVLGYIRAGDIYQANLSQRFVARGRPDPLELHRRLRSISPAPFSAYLGWDDFAILSASPELFYRTEADRIVTRPIKGTRPRSPDPIEDQAFAAELVASAKDRAELTMIVDLERNDLGRVCRFGSVRVTEPGAVESFEQVHHLVATIEGRLRPEVGPVDVIRSVFPGGSITGAPKIRSMEIIDELEPNRRSVYTGAIGYLSRSGLSAFNIAIRTLLVEGDRLSFQVGGGIVADSDPALEYAETLHKARGMLQLLEEFREAR